MEEKEKQELFGRLIEKLDNTAEYEDLLILMDCYDNLEQENKELKEQLQLIKLGSDALNGLVGKYASEIEYLKEILSMKQELLDKIYQYCEEQIKYHRSNREHEYNGFQMIDYYQEILNLFTEYEDE